MISIKKQSYSYFYKTLLSNKKMNVDFEIANGSTPLMMAANKESEKIVAKLIKYGAEVNRQDNKGRSALMRAVKKGNIEVIKVLLEKKADVNATTKDGKSVRDYNISEKKEEISKLLDESDEQKKQKETIEKAQQQEEQEKKQIAHAKKKELAASDGRSPYPIQFHLSYQYFQTPFDTSSDSIYESKAGINNYGFGFGYHINRALYVAYEYHAGEFEATSDNEVTSENAAKEIDKNRYFIDYAKSLFITNQLYFRISPFVGITFLEGFYLQLGAAQRDWQMEMRGSRIIGESSTSSVWDAEIKWPSAAYTAGLGYTYVFDFGMSFNIAGIYYGGSKPEYTFEVRDGTISQENIELEKKNFEKEIIDPATNWIAGQFSLGWNF